MAWYGIVRSQEGHYKSDLVRLWRFNAVLVELLDDQAVGDDDDDGRDEKDCDGDSPDPVGAKKCRFKKINILVPEKYFYFMLPEKWEWACFEVGDVVIVPGRQQRHRLHQTKKPTRDNGEVDEQVPWLETILKEILVVVHDKPMKIILSW